MQHEECHGAISVIAHVPSQRRLCWTQVWEFTINVTHTSTNMYLVVVVVVVVGLSKWFCGGAFKLLRDSAHNVPNVMRRKALPHKLQSVMIWTQA